MKYLLIMFFLVSCAGDQIPSIPTTSPNPIPDSTPEETETVLVEFCKALPIASVIPELPDNKKKERNKCVQKCLKHEDREDD